MLHSPASARSRLTITAEPGTDLQASLIRLPPQTARLGLRVEPVSQPGCVRLVLTAHDADVTLNAAAWERLVPDGGRTQDTSYRRDECADQKVLAWFGQLQLKAGETRRSAAIPVPSHLRPVVFKVAATDTNGHCMAAWAVVATGQSADQSR
jgi:hypothetical protein